MTYGITKAIAIPTLMERWEKLKATGLGDRVSIRVFEGDLYSLFDDDDFYEDNRHLINSTTYSWDSIRELLLGIVLGQMLLVKNLLIGVVEPLTEHQKSKIN